MVLSSRSRTFRRLLERSRQSETSWQNQLFIKSAGVKEIPVTEGADLISSPLWSYDGKYLAYLAKSKTGNQQTCIWIFDTAANALYRLLTLKQDIMSFKWSPDASRIAFIAGDIDHKSDAATTKLIDVSRGHVNMRLYSIAVSRK